MQQREYKTLNCRPYHIQRGTFKDIPDSEIVGLDSLVAYDYMGSSEFEFGALYETLKRVTSSWDKFSYTQIDEIKDCNDQYLFIVARKEQFDEIKLAVIDMALGKYGRTKEFVGLHEYLEPKHDYHLKINFWWDIDNDWFCCFGDNIRRLIIGINKVCIKHKTNLSLQVPQPIIKPKPSHLTIEENRGQIIVVTITGRKTIISKRNILDIKDFPTQIEIKVKTKSGVERFIQIQDVEPSNEKTLLLNMLTSELDYNKFANKNNL